MAVGLGREDGLGERDDKVRGRERGGGELYRPARLLLAGRVVFWHFRWRGAKLGVGRGNNRPGTWIRTLGGGELKTGWGNEITGRRGGRDGRKAGESASGLSNPGSQNTGANQVARLTTVSTEIVLSAATTLLRVEGTWTTRTIHLHGTSASDREDGLRAVGRRRTLLLLLLLVLRATFNGSRLVVLDRNGCSNVRLKLDRYVATSGDFETDGFF